MCLGRSWIPLPWPHPTLHARASAKARSGNRTRGGFKEQAEQTDPVAGLLHALPLLHMLGGGGEGLPVDGNHMDRGLQKVLKSQPSKHKEKIFSICFGFLQLFEVPLRATGPLPLHGRPHRLLLQRRLHVRAAAQHPTCLLPQTYQPGDGIHPWKYLASHSL